MHYQETGTHATIYELKVLEVLQREASSPMFVKSLSDAKVRDKAKHTLQKRVHKAALDHGLPEIEGFYGINMGTGQFLKFD